MLVFYRCYSRNSLKGCEMAFEKEQISPKLYSSKIL